MIQITDRLYAIPISAEAHKIKSTKRYISYREKHSKVVTTIYYDFGKFEYIGCFSSENNNADFDVTDHIDCSEYLKELRENTEQYFILSNTKFMSLLMSKSVDVSGKVLIIKKK